MEIAVVVCVPCSLFVCDLYVQLPVWQSLICIYFTLSLLCHQGEREPPETYVVARYIENPYLIGGEWS